MSHHHVEPKRLVYGHFKSLNTDYFEEEFSSKLDFNIKGYTTFEDNL